MSDISDRARHVLGLADVVACEDTRRTGRLLSALGISAPRLMRVDAHTEGPKSAAIIEALTAGQRVALVSDAGTPGVSDPGARLVAACVDEGVQVVAIPGPSACLAALVCSGLPTDRFMVEGFLPRKGPDRRALLGQIAEREATTVLYESPQRTAATLDDLLAVCGPERLACVARELTKLHEHVVTASLRELSSQFAGPLKGEVVIVVGPAPRPAGASAVEIESALQNAAADGVTRRTAVDDVASALGCARGRVYDVALTIDWPSRDSS